MLEACKFELTEILGRYWQEMIYVLDWKVEAVWIFDWISVWKMKYVINQFLRNCIKEELWYFKSWG